LHISHVVGNNRISKEVNKEVGFLITNREGGFFNLGISSVYRGLFFPFYDDVLRTLENINVFGFGEVLEVRNNLWNFERIREGIKESFFMPFSENALVLELDNEADIEALFDFKKAYDGREWGRNYYVYAEQGKIIVEFSKKTDYREDDSNENEEYNAFLAIDSGNNFEHGFRILNEWVRQDYSFDKKRNGKGERFVYKGLSVKSDMLVFAFSENKQEAIKVAEKVKKNLNMYKSLQKKYSKVRLNEVSNDKIGVALKCAVESLDNLTIQKQDGKEIDIYAGLPWFFQSWSRDTMISLKGLMLDKEYDNVKKILMTYLGRISDNGLLPNRYPSTITSCADSIGWFFKRWYDFIDILQRRGIVKSYLGTEEIALVRKKLELAMNDIFKNFTLNHTIS
jgi:glycogen debranching enzyme